MSLDFLNLFLEEAEEQLDLLEKLLLELEETGSQEVLDAIFRVAHTLKGSAACVGLKQVSEFAHKMENLLDRLRRSEVPLSPNICSLLLQGRDVLRSLVRAAREGDPEVILEEAAVVGKSFEHTIKGSLDGETPGAFRFVVEVRLDPASSMKEARAFVLLKRLEEVGNVEASTPEAEDLLRGGISPERVTAIVNTAISEEDLRGCLAGYPDVLSVDIMYAVEFDCQNWESCRQKAEALSAAGKRVALKLEREKVRLDAEALKRLAAAALKGYSLYATDPFFQGILNRMTFGWT
ncbi:Hpt domain-containing protein [Moorellaceae bacterium AZ2]